MKVLLINGSPNQAGCTFTALTEVAKTLSAQQIDSEILYLGKRSIAGCIACNKCRETGHCFYQDIVREGQDRLSEFDALIIGAPTYYSVPAGQLVAVVNRWFHSHSTHLAWTTRAPGGPDCVWS